MEHLFSPNSRTDLRSDAHQSQIIGGDADDDHTQIVGGDTVKLLGGYIPLIPPRFGHHWLPGCNDAKLVPANSLHTSTKYKEYKENLIFFI